MARSARIDVDIARRFVDAWSHPTAPWQRELDALISEIRRTLGRLDRAPTKARPKRKGPVPIHRPSKALRDACDTMRLVDSKRERRAAIRENVAQRAADAGGLCECGCGQQVRDDEKGGGCYPEARGEMDHFWGRGKGREPEFIESCWFLRPACHFEKTRNQPDAATWLKKFIEHCRARGYFAQRMKAEARLRFVETRSTLPAAPRTRP